MSKTIFITGASSGIGRATALYFHEKGWNVVATMRRPEEETELDKLDNVLVTRLDVLDLDSITAAVRSAIDFFGQVDVLVNNAGYGAYGPLEVTPREKILRQFNTNVIGLMDVTKALLPHFRENRSGHIVNISSVGGRTTFPLGTLYHGTKWAVEGLSEALSYEMREIGVKVKVVEPGAIATDFGGRSFDMTVDPSVEEYQGIVGAMMTAMGPMMEHAAPARLVAEVIMEAVTDGTDRLRYIAGEDAKVMVGARIQVDEDAFMTGLRQQFGLN